MGTHKKEASRRTREGKASDGIPKTKGENFYRSAKRVKQLNIFKDGKPQRNSEGKITKAASYQSRDVPTAVIEPNRRWFNASRVVSQESLQTFRKAMEEQANDPYKVLLKRNKLPMSLIQDGLGDGAKKHQAKMTVEVSPFSDVFGSKATRKRPKLNVSSISDLAEDAEKNLDTYKDRLDQAKLLSGRAGEAEVASDFAVDEETLPTVAKEPVFAKGQSKRIWNELYRVLDSSDVILHILDARNPLETRCRSVEEYLRKEAPHKHLVFVLNKCDLVPSSVAAAWVKSLQKEVPTCAVKSNITNPFGKGSLIALLRQFSSLHKDRKQISVGLVGYPNVGKSSLINMLRGKKTCNVAPIPGETKVWQYITLMKRIYLIDCPGIVPPDSNASAEDILLRGVVRTEKIENPSNYISGVMARTKRHHLARTYEVSEWNDPTHFLELLARKGGRLLKGGEPDLDTVAIMVINDFLRGKIPWFSPPPSMGDDVKEIEGRAGRLGEMPRKRKRDDLDSMPDTSIGDCTTAGDDQKAEESQNEIDDDEFEGFGSDSEPSSGGFLEDNDIPQARDDEEDFISVDGSEEVDGSGSSDQDSEGRGSSDSRDEQVE